MMENKCNQTPNKYLDHVYCQPSTESRIPGYMRASNNNAGSGGAGGGNNGSDFLAMLKENKQLKAMLILHLDLIQEQSDQLIAKDKQIVKLSEEVLAERNKIIQLEKQVQEIQRQLQRQLKRAAATNELSLLSPPPLAKIQNKKADSASPSPTNNIIGECNGKLISKIVLQRNTFAESTHSPNSTTTVSDTTSEDAGVQQDQQQQKNIEDVYDINEELTTDESNDACEANEDKTEKTRTHLTALPRGAKPRRPLLSAGLKVATTTGATTPMQVCVTPPTPSRGKQMPLMLWHAPDMHTDDESGSCDSAGEGQQLSTPAVSPVPAPAEKSETTTTTPKTTKSRSRTTKTTNSVRLQSSQRKQQKQQQQPLLHKHKRRSTYFTTSSEYLTREWEDEDEKVCDYEFSREEADAIHAEAPMLEIPKWTEHDLSPSYCIEGTEDLSDESFLKRHAKLEIDEKRRKKWDVQQIREQRRVEKLKQRHYKNEIQEEQILKSFFPQPDGIQSICYVNELPVQAFGETIPKINSASEFMLPWLQIDQGDGEKTTTAANAAGEPLTAIPPPPPVSHPVQTSAVEIMANSTASSTFAQANQQMTKSTFVFLKKRKRQQSSSAAVAAANSMGTQRQRSAAAATGAGAIKQQTQSSTTILTTASETTTTATISSTPSTNLDTTEPDAQAHISQDVAKTSNALEQN